MMGNWTFQLESYCYTIIMPIFIVFYNILNIVYNFADLINKGAFGLCIWSAAVADREELEGALLG